MATNDWAKKLADKYVTTDGKAPGSVLLDDVYAFLNKFIAYPSEQARVAHTLWAAHSHLMDAWESTPRLAFLSPEPESGKTRCLEISELLVSNPEMLVEPSAAYVYRSFDESDTPPTILFDEVDNLFRSKDSDKKDILAILNSGHRRGAYVGRCTMEGKKVHRERIHAFAAVALAGIGWLPDALLTRAIVIRMQRRSPNEVVSSYRRRLYADEGQRLHDRLAAWASTILDDVRDAWPELPTGIEDRRADMWEPLLAVADAAGGDWPDRARAAAVVLVRESQERTPSINLRLLADVRTVFEDEAEKASSAILAALYALEESPWNDLIKGKPLTREGLARRLKEYGITPVRIQDRPTVRGYLRKDLEPIWAKYLSVPLGGKLDALDALDAPVELQGFTSVRSAAAASSHLAQPGAQKPNNHGHASSASSASSHLGKAGEDAFEERAAALEYEAGLSRVEAEEQAHREQADDFPRGAA